MRIAGNKQGHIAIQHKSGCWIIKPKEAYKEAVRDELYKNFTWFSTQKTFGFGLLNLSGWINGHGESIGGWEDLITGKRWE